MNLVRVGGVLDVSGKVGVGWRVGRCRSRRRTRDSRTVTPEERLGVCVVQRTDRNPKTTRKPILKRREPRDGVTEDEWTGVAVEEPLLR